MSLGIQTLSGFFSVNYLTICLLHTKDGFSDVRWALIKNHVSSIGSKIKMKILKAWKSMMEKI
jgi:hypothetical protein